MTRTRIGIAVAAVALVGGASLFGGIMRGSSSAGVQARGPRVEPERLQSGFSTGDTASLIRAYQAGLQADPKDAKGYGLLGLAYQQRARETGDPTYYTKSEGVLRRALALAPNDLIATVGLGSLALSRHRFGEALELGREARKISPGMARTYGVTGDALVELGRYPEAFDAFRRMITLKPSLASYARWSYRSELTGHRPAAIKWMGYALETAQGQPEALAWTNVQLGKLYWAAGRLEPAERLFRASLAAFPGYVYGYDALAQVEAARGNLRRAIQLESRAADSIPQPQFVSTLGDLYRARGQKRLAAERYATVGVIRRLLEANGVKTDLETALFNVDHGIEPARTLALARLAQRERPSIDGDDVLAWALARTGRCEEALGYSKRALRLGTLDALKMFHRGMIERCLGRRVASDAWLRRALALNPHFSILWAPVARRALG